ncbi:MAG: pantoate--beta-alanine ligase [Rickettsiales bacterium]|nr:pantoate--beta-alanine ligase [Pseudomonadota bacterium]MDA0965931.1 pantoate--beta-alanine ligase [Pseudomonadota bacterium]MDG4542599.1 pantoate--beta-alanine ligase [Rickettsiales bacterium]MDG4545103.1 pantoate--beta-alanine ligase [Rickettsiales bacterium]MDG4547226.1 pantoate--beta-alanine ligase [Rickettsiales bacterium]
MLSVVTKSDLRNVVARFRKEGKKIGFVPTMGALHEGHLSLVDIAKQSADIVVVSIFVNPTQFAEGEDFDKYPRTIEDDKKKLQTKNVDIVYLPSKEEMYPQGFDIKISVGQIAKELEGVTRPHFFDGVALVVNKLFMQVQPDIAVFGQKDYQQLHVIRKLVAAFDIAVKVIGADIVREKNGLAMSSRNRYLSDEKRELAANLYRIMNEVANNIKKGSSFEKALYWGKEELQKAGFTKVDYLEIRNPQTLLKTDSLPARLLAAVYLDEVRLIDNIQIV